MSRAVVRTAVVGWLDPGVGSLWAAATPGPPDALDKVWPSFPKRIDFKANARIPDIRTRAQAIVFVKHQSQTRESIGGAHLGWKKKSYDVIVQVFAQSAWPDSDQVMGDIDTLADAIEARVLADHTFGQPSTAIFRAAEPNLDLDWGEPFLNAAAMTEQWFQLLFTVEQFQQA